VLVIFLLFLAIDLKLAPFRTGTILSTCHRCYPAKRF
jgi:hypothetical protein